MTREDFFSELAAVPLIDAHCHPFQELLPPDADAFLRLFSLAMPDRDIPRGRPLGEPRSVLQEQAVRALAGLLGLPADGSLAGLVAERNRQAADLGRYTRRLFDDAGISGLVVDTGFPQPPIPVDEFRATAGRPVWELFRIEPLMNRLFEAEFSWDDFRARYLEALAEAAGRPYVGFKSVIAYYTGLAVAEASAEDAARGLAEWRSSGQAMRLKPLRDWCLLEAMKVAGEAGKPMQIHAAAGASGIKLPLAHAALLFDVLGRKPYKRFPVVLVHGGYPWSAEAGYIAHVLGNVYLDFSLQCPFASFDVEDELARILAVAPVDKVMWGSDGFNVPEIAWLAAHQGRRYVGRVLWGLCEEGEIGAGFARASARRVLAENARELYGLAPA